MLLFDMNARIPRTRLRSDKYDTMIMVLIVIALLCTAVIKFAEKKFPDVPDKKIEAVVCTAGMALFVLITLVWYAVG